MQLVDQMVVPFLWMIPSTVATAVSSSAELRRVLWQGGGGDTTPRSNSKESSFHLNHAVGGDNIFPSPELLTNAYHSVNESKSAPSSLYKWSS
mmetsp:Transcript_43607/g.79731  ORF Transcript_43607/g.79731 Transcript_43607/m.79731 type:complete len:93 (-) Transcript_43607:368-646(-)